MGRIERPSCTVRLAALQCNRHHFIPVEQFRVMLRTEGGFSVYHGASDFGSAAGEFFPGATTSIDSTNEVSSDRPSRPSCVV